VKHVAKLKQLENLSYFDLETLSQITDLKGNTLYKNVSRWKEQGIIIQLKRGVYTTSGFALKQDTKSYLEFVSNKLRYPSYLSLEYVLQKYSLLTEGVYAFTSITLKKTNTYKNKLGLFTYSNISQNLFTGYKIVNKEGFQIKEASKAKALFDFLYLRLLSVKNINKSLIDSFRFNLDEFSQKDQKEFKSYVKLSKIKKLEKASLWLA